MNKQAKVLDSSVVAVTVYQDRAEVTRKASITLEPGLHTLVFDLLPASIEEKSIQVNGEGAKATLSQVKFLTEHYEVSPDEVIRKLKAQGEALHDERKLLKDKARQLKGQQTFLQGITDRVTRPMKGQKKIKMTDWLAMLEFYRNKQLRIDEATQDLKLKFMHNDDALRKVKADFEKFRGQRHQTKRRVEVNVEIAEAGELHLSLAYMVYGAGWEPFYDFRVFTETEELEMTYRAIVHQNTEEPWNDVTVKLSTAQPHIGGRQPELPPWRIKTYTAPTLLARSEAAKAYGKISEAIKEEERNEEISAKQIRDRLKATMEEVRNSGNGNRGGGRSKAKALKKARRQNYDDDAPEEKERGITINSSGYDASSIDKFLELDEKRKILDEHVDLEQAMAVNKPPAVTSTTTKVRKGGTAVTFETEGIHTVKNDGTEHQLTILLNTFSIQMEYSAVPKLSAYTYLRTRATNNTEYPLLAGSTNIFLDNNFVANASIDTVAPTESFWTFLGIDEGVRVERKFLKKYEKKEGSMFSKKHRHLVYEYLITANNFKNRTIRLVIKDQLPVSQHDDVKIQLLKPAYIEDTDELKINELKYLEWSYTIEAGKDLKIPFEFSVTYPDDVWLSGMD